MFLTLLLTLTITKTGIVGGSTSFSITVVPDGDYEFNSRSDVSDSISGVSLGAAIPEIDQFGSWMRNYSRLFSSQNESVTITLSGSATSTAPPPPSVPCFMYTFKWNSGVSFAVGGYTRCDGVPVGSAILPDGFQICAQENTPTVATGGTWTKGSLCS